MSSQTLEQITERDCEVLILGDIQKQTGRGPQETALADPVLRREFESDDLQRSILTSILSSLLLHCPLRCLFCISEVLANFQLFILPFTVSYHSVHYEDTL